jgi:hypothetical protein
LKIAPGNGLIGIMSATISALKKATRIDARQAASAAAAYFKELYPNVVSFSLEEVELSEDGSHWLITLSFEIPANPRLGGVLVQFQPPKTKFKVFKVDAKTGKVVAMKIRKLE